LFLQVAKDLAAPRGRLSGRETGRTGLHLLVVIPDQRIAEREVACSTCGAASSSRCSAARRLRGRSRRARSRRFQLSCQQSRHWRRTFSSGTREWHSATARCNAAIGHYWTHSGHVAGVAGVPMPCVHSACYGEHLSAGIVVPLDARARRGSNLSALPASHTPQSHA
jgi:hypothetical protein